MDQRGLGSQRPHGTTVRRNLTLFSSLLIFFLFLSVNSFLFFLLFFQLYWYYLKNSTHLAEILHFASAGRIWFWTTFKIRSTSANEWTMMWLKVAFSHSTNDPGCLNSFRLSGAAIIKSCWLLCDVSRQRKCIAALAILCHPVLATLRTEVLAVSEEKNVPIVSAEI